MHVRVCVCDDRIHPLHMRKKLIQGIINIVLSVSETIYQTVESSSSCRCAATFSHEKLLKIYSVTNSCSLSIHWNSDVTSNTMRNSNDFLRISFLQFHPAQVELCHENNIVGSFCRHKVKCRSENRWNWKWKRWRWPRRQPNTQKWNVILCVCVCLRWIKCWTICQTIHFPINFIVVVIRRWLNFEIEYKFLVEIRMHFISIAVATARFALSFSPLSGGCEIFYFYNIKLLQYYAIFTYCIVFIVTTIIVIIIYEWHFK